MRGFLPVTTKFLFLNLLILVESEIILVVFDRVSLITTGVCVVHALFWCAFFSFGSLYFTDLKRCWVSPQSFRSHILAFGGISNVLDCIPLFKFIRYINRGKNYVLLITERIWVVIFVVSKINFWRLRSALDRVLFKVRQFLIICFSRWK